MASPQRVATRSARSRVLLVAASLLVLTPAVRGRAADPASPFDLTVSLESNPQGTTRDRYEQILQDFADTVYDATEGAHRIERIRVFTGASAHDRADVIWQRRGRPESTLDGIRGPGHMYMVDTFTGGGPNGDDLPLVTNPDVAGDRAAGAVLAHEFAHYAYGLLDEHVIEPGDVPVSPSLMHSPWQVQNDVQWRNFSIRGAGPDGTGTGPFEDTGQTAQHRVYGRSAWELLTAAPDIRDRLSAAIPGTVSRVFYDDLVAPAGQPGTQGPAPAVTVEWQQPCSSYVIAIDSSGSMTGQRLSTAKSLAAVLLSSFAADTTRLSILSFSNTAVPRLGPAIVSDADLGGGQSQRDLFQLAIEQIVALPDPTSFAAGLAGAFDLLTDPGAACDADRTTRALFFLSDGTNTPGDDYADTLTALADAGIPIYVLDVNDFDPEATTNEMTPLVAATGGILLGPTAGFSQAQTAYREANAPLGTIHPLEQGSFRVPPNAIPKDVTLTVDSSLERLGVCVSSDGPLLSLSLSDPAGNLFPAAAARPSEPAVPGDDCSYFFAVDGPLQAGLWHLSATVASDQTTSVLVSYDAFGESLGDSIVLDAFVGNESGAPVTYPEPIYLIATLGRELPVTGARVDASLDGGTAFPLRDDGVPPDAVANDGRYTGALAYESDGVHDVLVTARNSLGIAAYSNVGLVRAPNIDGQALPADADVSIGGPLLRTVSLQVETVGMGSPETHLDDPDVLLDGRISSAGAIDLFTIDLPAIDAALGSPGALEVRVTGALLGMVPDLRVYDGPPGDPGTTLLGQASAAAGTSGVVVPVQASDGTVYAEVRNAQGGLGSYQVSAGAVLGLSFGPAGLSSSPCDLALADHHDAGNALDAGLGGVAAASALVEEAVGLEQAIQDGIGQLADPAPDTLSAGRQLKHTTKQGSKLLKQLTKLAAKGRDQKVPKTQRSIDKVRSKLQQACSLLADGGASLVP